MELNIIKISYSQKKVFMVFFHELKIDFIYTNIFYIIYVYVCTYINVIVEELLCTGKKRSNGRQDKRR